MLLLNINENFLINENFQLFWGIFVSCYYWNPVKWSDFYLLACLGAWFHKFVFYGHVCMYAYIYIYIYIYIYAYTYTCTCTHVHMCVCMCVCVWKHGQIANNFHLTMFRDTNNLSAQCCVGQRYFGVTDDSCAWMHACVYAYCTICMHTCTIFMFHYFRILSFDH